MQGESSCYWIADALRADPDVAAPLAEPITADVCIVGGGYAGLWTAIHLKERSPASTWLSSSDGCAAPAQAAATRAC